MIYCVVRKWKTRKVGFFQKKFPNGIVRRFRRRGNAESYIRNIMFGECSWKAFGLENKVSYTIKEVAA